MPVKYIRLLFGISFGFFCAQTAFADELPRTGEYTLIYIGINTSPIKPMPIGPNRALVPSHATMTAVNTAGSGFLHNLAGRCVGLATLDNDAKTVESHGYCVYADAAGDQIFEKYDYPVQAQGANLKGTAEWTGGTGKFSGISGDIQLTNTRLSAMMDGVTQVSGTKTGRYSFQNATSSLK
ncbi:hypothetical protein [Methylobacterium sp. CM6257]